MHYKKAISNYGIAQPLILATLVIAIAGGIYFYVNSELSKKETVFRNSSLTAAKATRLKNSSSANLAELARWEATMDLNPRTILEEQFNQSAASARSPQLERVSNSIANRKAPIALALESQPSQTYNLSFRGAYRDVQSMFVDFEYRLPNLVVENFTIEPANGSRTSVNCNITYSVWRK